MTSRLLGGENIGLMIWAGGNCRMTHDCWLSPLVSFRVNVRPSNISHGRAWICVTVWTLHRKLSICFFFGKRYAAHSCIRVEANAWTEFYYPFQSLARVLKCSTETTFSGFWNPYCSTYHLSTTNRQRSSSPNTISRVCLDRSEVLADKVPAALPKLNIFIFSNFYNTHCLVFFLKLWLYWFDATLGYRIHPTPSVNSNMVEIRNNEAKFRKSDESRTSHK
jgi:hypothetical protein